MSPSCFWCPDPDLPDPDLSDLPGHSGNVSYRPPDWLLCLCCLIPCCAPCGVYGLSRSAHIDSQDRIVATQKLVDARKYPMPEYVSPWLFCRYCKAPFDSSIPGNERRTMCDRHTCQYQGCQEAQRIHEYSLFCGTHRAIMAKRSAP